MRLTDLEPRWLAHDGNPHAILFFRCPHCRKTWLTATLVALKFREQCRAYEQLPPEIDRSDIVPCKMLAWTMTNGPSFETLTIAPSLDASAAQHWHGHVQDGAVNGGVQAGPES